jgi:hypothetical protein
VFPSPVAPFEAEKEGSMIVKHLRYDRGNDPVTRGFEVFKEGGALR